MNKTKLTKKEKERVEYFSKTLTKLISAWKKRTGKTQKDLAKEMNLATENSIPRWKKGESFPTSEHIEMLADILGVDPEVFNPRSRVLMPDDLAECLPKLKVQEDEIYKILVKRCKCCGRLYVERCWHEQ